MLGLTRRSSLPIRDLCLALSWAGILSAQTFSITTTSPLPTGTVGLAYSQTLTTAGGTFPYVFSLSSGSLPAGLLLSGVGVVSGTPTTSGVASFTVQAVDVIAETAFATFSLQIVTPPLSITTLSPLFPGTVGQAYVQAFTAVNGVQPYAWTIASGQQPGGLTLNSSTGVLSGTPQAAGTFTFTIQVADASHSTAQQTYSITVSAPVLTLSAVSSLAPGTVGVAYSQTLPLSATGGVPPYTWSLTSTPVPGLTFNPTGILLNGTPTTPGTFTLAVTVTDSAGNTASKSLNLTIAPSALTITTASQLPAGALNASYSQTFAAIGGVPPYSWSATGLPAGLTMSTTGAVSGILAAAGSFQVVVTVTDSALTSVKNLFTISVSYPAAPAITFSGLPATANPAQQYPLLVSLGSAYPVDILGTAILTFSPNSGPTDSTIQFASGGTTASFTVPAGATAPVSSVPLALQTGTGSGTLTVSLSFKAGGVDITPSPAPSMTTQIAAAAPVITKLTTTVTSTSLSVVVTGYSTAREVTQAVFTFSAATGQTLQTSASSITVDVSTLFGTWFVDPANSQFGSQFVFTQPFTIQGDPTQVIPVSVTLTNRTGSVTMNF